MTKTKFRITYDLNPYYSNYIQEIIKLEEKLCSDHFHALALSPIFRYKILKLLLKDYEIKLLQLNFKELINVYTLYGHQVYQEVASNFTSYRELVENNWRIIYKEYYN